LRALSPVAIVPDRDGTDFVPTEVVLDTSQNYLVASVHRMTLIACLEELFARVQIFGTELALAKYCQKEWPRQYKDEVIAEMKRGLGDQESTADKIRHLLLRSHRRGYGSHQNSLD
jgi:hypothetical protein